MDQKHGLKNFKQLLKRSFQPNESGKLGPKEKIQKTANMDFSDPISLRNANAGFVKLQTFIKEAFLSFSKLILFNLISKLKIQSSKLNFLGRSNSFTILQKYFTKLIL